MALDVQGLITNLAWDWDLIHPKPWFVNLDWIPAGKVAIQFAAAPLMVVIIAGLLYALARRFGRGENPLPLLPARYKALLALATLSPFAVFCMPFALGLSVWLSIEAFWWIQWYANVEPAMSFLHETAPYLLLPGIALLGILLLRWILKRPDAPRRPLLLRLFWKLVTIPIFIVLAAALLVGSVHASRFAGTDPGRKVFVQSCGSCHDLALSLYYIKAPVEWERTMKTQIEVEGVKLTSEEADDVTAFLVGMRSFDDEWSLRTRCGRCHVGGHPSGEKRTPDDWRVIVERFARWSPYYYRPDIRDQLVRELVRTQGEEGATLGFAEETYERYRQVGQGCATCHALSLEMEQAREWSGEEIRDLVDRMARKTPLPLAGDLSAEEIVQTYRELITDDQRFDRLFPHDRPVFAGGLPW